MKFSLVLATIGRTAEVERFADGLAAQHHGDFELIVVDQNPDARLAPVFERRKQRMSIRHLRSLPGLSRARNAALKHLSGEVVAFPDDDCLYPSDLLTRVAKILEERPDFDGVTVRAVDEKGRSVARFDRSAGMVTPRNVWRRVCSYGLFLRRAVVETVGDFDESLGIGSGTPWQGGEDIDYPLRGIQAGFKICYRPDLCVIHPDPMGAREWPLLAIRAHKYGMGIGRVWRKHRYPAWFAWYHIGRPIGGALLSLLAGDRGRAKFHWSAFRGRARGWMSRV
ncbi:MAG: glycosyltransferase family 2 protein [bacterium]